MRLVLVWAAAASWTLVVVACNMVLLRLLAKHCSSKRRWPFCVAA